MTDAPKLALVMVLSYLIAGIVVRAVYATLAASGLLCRCGLHEFWWPRYTENQAPHCRRCKKLNPNAGRYR